MRAILLIGAALLAACQPRDGEPTSAAAVRRENVALACLEYANALQAFTVLAERGAITPITLGRATVLRRQIGPQCDAREIAPEALLPMLRRATVELLAIEAAR